MKMMLMMMKFLNDSVPSSEIDHQVCKDVVESLFCLEEKIVIDEKV